MTGVVHRGEQGDLPGDVGARAAQGFAVDSDRPQSGAGRGCAGGGMMPDRSTPRVRGQAGSASGPGRSRGFMDVIETPTPLSSQLSNTLRSHHLGPDTAPGRR